MSFDPKKLAREYTEVTVFEGTLFAGSQTIQQLENKAIEILEEASKQPLQIREEFEQAVCSEANAAFRAFDVRAWLWNESDGVKLLLGGRRSSCKDKSLNHQLTANLLRPRFSKGLSLFLPPKLDEAYRAYSNGDASLSPDWHYKLNPWILDFRGNDSKGMVAGLVVLTLACPIAGLVAGGGLGGYGFASGLHQHEQGKTKTLNARTDEEKKEALEQKHRGYAQTSYAILGIFLSAFGVRSHLSKIKTSEPLSQNIESLPTAAKTPPSQPKNYTPAMLEEAGIIPLSKKIKSQSKQAASENPFFWYYLKNRRSTAPLAVSEQTHLGISRPSLPNSSQSAACSITPFYSQENPIRYGQLSLKSAPPKPVQDLAPSSDSIKGAIPRQVQARDSYRIPKNELECRPLDPATGDYLPWEKYLFRKFLEAAGNVQIGSAAFVMGTGGSNGGASSGSGDDFLLHLLQRILGISSPVPESKEPSSQDDSLENKKIERAELARIGPTREIPSKPYDLLILVSTLEKKLYRSVQNGLIIDSMGNFQGNYAPSTHFQSGLLDASVLYRMRQGGRSLSLGARDGFAEDFLNWGFGIPEAQMDLADIQARRSWAYRKNKTYVFDMYAPWPALKGPYKYIFLPASFLSEKEYWQDWHRPEEFWSKHEKKIEDLFVKIVENLALEGEGRISLVRSEPFKAPAMRNLEARIQTRFPNEVVRFEIRPNLELEKRNPILIIRRETRNQSLSEDSSSSELSLLQRAEHAYQAGNYEEGILWVSQARKKKLEDSLELSRLQHKLTWSYLQQQGAYPFRDLTQSRAIPTWQQKLMYALPVLNKESLQPKTLALSQIVPIHSIYHATETHGPLETINQMKASFLAQLHRSGWQRGEIPSSELLAQILYSGENSNPASTLPVVSRFINGHALLLGGHHRLAALISLVADGILPQESLNQIPVVEASPVNPSEVLYQTFGLSSEHPEGEDYSWEKVMNFSPMSRNLVREIGATTPLRAFPRVIKY